MRNVTNAHVNNYLSVWVEMFYMFSVDWVQYTTSGEILIDWNTGITKKDKKIISSIFDAAFVLSY